MAGAAAFTGTAKIIFTAIRLAAKFAPTFFSGIGSLISAIESKASTATAPLGVADIHELAEQHSVDLHKVDEVIAGLTPAGQ